MRLQWLLTDLMVSIMPEYLSCLVHSSRSKVRASLNSLGLMQRTKKGWHWLRVCMRDSSDFLNWMARVGDFLRVSVVCGTAETKLNKL